MATVTEELDQKIAEIEQFLSGFKSLAPGKETRRIYTSETVGDAEHYLHGVLVLLRKARREIGDET